MAAWIEERQGVQNIYFTVNAVFGPVTSKPNKGAVSAIRALHVDVDPRPGEDFDTERVRAERVLRAYRPEPTVIIDSGGGFQGFWMPDEERPVGGSADLARLVWRDAKPEERGPLSAAERAEVDAHHARLWDAVEARNLHIEVALQGDSCHNADRIMRLPGTVNVPGEKKRKKGRTARVASVVATDWSRRYRLEDFDSAPKATSGPAPATAGPARSFAAAAELLRRQAKARTQRLRQRPFREAAHHAPLGAVAVEEVEHPVAQPLAEPRLPSLKLLFAPAVLVVVVVGIGHERLERPRRLLRRDAKLRQ